MKNALLVLLFALFLNGCVQKSPFVSPVATDKKPWSHLSFHNQPDHFRFAIVSDRNGGNRPGIFEQAIGKLNLLQPEFVLSVGDLISGYSSDTTELARQWAEVHHDMASLQMPWFYLPGNHDIGNNVMRKEWEKRYGVRYYHFLYHQVLFLILDTNDEPGLNLSEKQTQSVIQALQANKEVKWTFLLMHHPVWKYETGGRFQQIEKELSGRSYTVIAGHEHHYMQEERNHANYYILSTTGAGSQLRGNYFGEFDHVVWVAMSDNGPILSNLRLDGILPQDISNGQTDLLAKQLVENANINHLILCNNSDTLKSGTIYFSFHNSAATPLQVNLDFFQHTQLSLGVGSLEKVVAPGKDEVLEVPFSIKFPRVQDSIIPLKVAWKLSYLDPTHPDFGLSGNVKIDVKPTRTAYLAEDLPLFTQGHQVVFSHPYVSLESRYRFTGEVEHRYEMPLELKQSSSLSFRIINSRNETTAVEEKQYEKRDLIPATEVNHPLPGLAYSYYEGVLNNLSGLSKLTAVGEGVATDFLVTNYAKRSNFWALRFSGWINIPTDGIYLFRTRVDKACRIFLDGELVLDDRKILKGESNGILGLKKGYHPIRIEYLQGKGDARLRCYWRKATDEDWSPLEFSQLFH
ncbi:MAG: PA14 domain-containing protein [Marinilabiliales bacterium]|nr:PA14 domain-containing protein [Marinilabiliales bacterium]